MQTAANIFLPKTSIVCANHFSKPQLAVVVYDWKFASARAVVHIIQTDTISVTLKSYDITGGPKSKPLYRLNRNLNLWKDLYDSYTDLYFLAE